MLCSGSGRAKPGVGVCCCWHTGRWACGGRPPTSRALKHQLERATCVLAAGAAACQVRCRHLPKRCTLLQVFGRSWPHACSKHMLRARACLACCRPAWRPQRPGLCAHAAASPVAMAVLRTWLAEGGASSCYARPGCGVVGHRVCWPAATEGARIWPVLQVSSLWCAVLAGTRLRLARQFWYTALRH